ncbi:GAF domain-containing protein [Aestuariibacter salexigens]|uniref:GAF domain-containing protein n=1 Tax=Aestuariibacter salexigens TaxID=226010 RepID=UPI0004082B09|nr:GAF domain-containing protein [Aestuariibacter salexigens]
MSDDSLQGIDVSLLSKEQLMAIVDALASLIRTRATEQESLEIIVNLACQLTYSAGAAVEKVVDDHLVYVGVTDNTKHNDGLHIPLEGSLSGRCLNEKRLLRCDDAQTDDRVDKEACEKVGLRSMMVAPVTFDGGDAGVLKVFSMKACAYDDVDEQILRVFTTIVSHTLAEGWPADAPQ